MRLTFKLHDSMFDWLAILRWTSSLLKTRAAFSWRILHSVARPASFTAPVIKDLQLNTADRLLWVWLSRVWTNWRSSLVTVKPERLLHGTAKRSAYSGRGRSGKARPGVRRSTGGLRLSRMSREIAGWGVPRIHGELLKLSIDVAEASVSKYLLRNRKPPSQTWRIFLEYHVQSLALLGHKVSY